MYPTYEQGDILLVRRNQAVAVGDKIIVKHAAERSVKSIAKLKGAYIYTTTDNVHSPRGKRKYERIHKRAILGKVIWPKDDR